MQRKEALKAIDFDGNGALVVGRFRLLVMRRHTGKMSAIEYLVWKFKKTVPDTINAPQGDNTAAIKAAQAKLDVVMKQLAECEANLEKQKKAVEENAQAQAELKKQEAALQVAEQELQVALRELKAQEDEVRVVATPRRRET